MSIRVLSNQTNKPLSLLRALLIIPDLAEIGHLPCGTVNQSISVFSSYDYVVLVRVTGIRDVRRYSVPVSSLQMNVAVVRVG